MIVSSKLFKFMIMYLNHLLGHINLIYLFIAKFTYFSCVDAMILRVNYLHIAVASYTVIYESIMAIIMLANM